MKEGRVSELYGGTSPVPSDALSTGGPGEPIGDDGDQGGGSNNYGNLSSDGNTAGADQGRDGMAGWATAEKRQRQSSPNSDDMVSLRFACPYQVYEPL